MAVEVFIVQQLERNNLKCIPTLLLCVVIIAVAVLTVWYYVYYNFVFIVIIIILDVSRSLKSNGNSFYFHELRMVGSEPMRDFQE